MRTLSSFEHTKASTSAPQTVAFLRCCESSRLCKAHLSYSLSHFAQPLDFCFGTAGCRALWESGANANLTGHLLALWDDRSRRCRSCQNQIKAPKCLRCESHSTASEQLVTRSSCPLICAGSCDLPLLSVSGPPCSNSSISTLLYIVSGKCSRPVCSRSCS